MNYFNELGNAIAQIDGAVEHWIVKLGLTYNHFAVLYSLADNADGTTQKQICDEWYIPKQTIFNICKEYKEKGLLEFYPSATDKREKIMRLTDAGRAVAEPILAKTHDISKQVFAEFGTEKTAQLFALMHEFSVIFNQKVATHD
ncbi:MarR family transcriptional regulator [Moraxella sp. FZLJ2107]|uniref:MarR family winged helix-turn-helix transcriptional regulator n=1 Tax=unclassified Moraxella TaxID=2685852 RepID=UPI0020C8EA58|nr:MULTISPECIES: MarR family transcriptional regulator [unclassified Moraxella]UTO05135.1 MarR family transcriptional regulator [Moraxella sp. FZLJ2107]UTO21870.1 MarR family transcriptional regulator [Moraxella sp. FZLJ2109]